jgi:hypothetical protein
VLIQGGLESKKNSSRGIIFSLDFPSLQKLNPPQISGSSSLGFCLH